MRSVLIFKFLLTIKGNDMTTEEKRLLWFLTVIIKVELGGTTESAEILARKLISIMDGG